MSDYATALAVPGADPVTTTSDDDYMALARERFNRCVESESELRRAFLDDLAFYDGDQWPADVAGVRRADHRPCIVVNRLPQFVHQVSNNIRQQKPSPKVSPVDDTGDPKTAEVLQGLIRHIEQQSNAAAVRSYAAFYQIVCGRGYYRILTEYPDAYSMDQEIFIQRIKNPATVYFDPSCQEPDYSDALYCFIVEDLTEEEFKRKYPGKPLASAEDYRSTGDGDPGWRRDGGVRVAEYFHVEQEQVEIAMLQDGSVVESARVPPELSGLIVKTRMADMPVVKWCKMDGSQKLEESTWPGRYIPVIPILGEEYDIDGRTKLVGMIRHAKDPQRMCNYWESAKTETIALAPRVPWVVAEGQIENHEQEWAQSNVRNFAYLQYKPKSVGQELAPPPQRQVYEPPVQAITMAEGQAVEHLKATTGIYDASLGNRSNETSGIGIRQRQMQGDTANYHYVDNLATAITHETRVLVDLIPKVYNRPGRVARILGEDGSRKSVTLNQEFDEGGALRIYDLNAGRYDVVAEIGPSYATKRNESADGMMQFAQAAPELVPRYADLLVQAQDWPKADEIANRVRPPDVPAPGQEDNPLPPQAQQAIGQLQQQNQQLSAVVEQLSQIIQGKQVEAASKERMQTQQIASDERIAAEKNQVNLVSKAVETDSRDSIALLMAELKNLELRMKEIQAREALDARMQQAQEANQTRLQQTDMQAQARQQQGPRTNGGLG
jgi:Phage P22-like portal protein